MKLFLVASVAALSLGMCAPAFAQTQPIPGAVRTNGDPAPVSGVSPIIAPAGGGPGMGKPVAEDHGFPVNCIVGCSGGSLAINPPGASGTIASGGAFQTVFSANLARTNCLIQNPVSATEPLYIHYTSDGATLANSYSLGPGASFSCAGSGTVVTGAVQVAAATTAHPFVASGS